MSDSEYVDDIRSKSQLDEIMSSDRPAVIDFWASWCGPCKAMAPQFEAVAEEYADEGVDFYKLNTERHPDLSRIFNVRSIPTVIFALEGEVTDHSVGAMNAQKLAKRVDRLLAKARGEKVGFFEKIFG